jgi:hypothetical protein
MCFSFLNCFDKFVVPIQSLKIGKQIQRAKYECIIIMSDKEKPIEKRVILSSSKIIRLTDAMTSEVKNSIVFPPCFYPYRNIRSTSTPEELFQRIIKREFDQIILTSFDYQIKGTSL